MTVDFMRRNMSGEEYGLWSTFYKKKAQRVELESLKAGG